MKLIGRLFLALATVCAILLAGAFLGGQVARGDTMQSWDLNVCNTALQAVSACAGPAPAMVDATLNSAATEITLTVTAGTNFKLWDGGIFGFNWSGPAITADLTGSTGSKAPYTVNADNGANLDGFGTFTNAWDLKVAGLGGSSNGPLSLTFTLTGTGLSFSDFTKNNKGQLFASHVADFASTNSDGPATGFVADGPSPPRVPEPFTYLLVGGGLVGITAARKLRRTT
jgi:hypothetical protein